MPEDQATAANSIARGNTHSRRAFLTIVLTASASPLFAGSSSSKERSYKTGYSSVLRLGRDIHAALKDEHREKIAPQPISIETSDKPFARPMFLQDGEKEVRGVWISAGFIDLVNQVAHAKAIATQDKNYFRSYAMGLEQETGDLPLRTLPDIDEARNWRDEVLNEQQTNFNSIMGMVVGMKLANHYLGHYDKYAEKLEGKDGREEAINNLLSEKEWMEAFTHGVRNAVRAGCMTEGVVPLLEALDRMKVRPPWAADFLPDDVKFSSMRKDLESIQRRFLEDKE